MKVAPRSVLLLLQVERSESDVDDFRHFLDGSQYQMQGILRYERMFGHGFVSTGGRQSTKEVISKIQLKEGAQVLDVGEQINSENFAQQTSCY